METAQPNTRRARGLQPRLAQGASRIGKTNTCWFPSPYRVLRLPTPNPATAQNPTQSLRTCVADVSRFQVHPGCYDQPRNGKFSETAVFRSLQGAATTFFRGFELNRSESPFDLNLYIVRYVGVVNHIENRFAPLFLAITRHQGSQRIPQTERGAFRPDQAPQVARKHFGLGHRLSKLDDLSGSDSESCRVRVLADWRVRMPGIFACLVNQNDNFAAFDKSAQEVDFGVLRRAKNDQGVPFIQSSRAEILRADCLERKIVSSHQIHRFIVRLLVASDNSYVCDGLHSLRWKTRRKRNVSFHLVPKSPCIRLIGSQRFLQRLWKIHYHVGTNCFGFGNRQGVLFGTW